MRSVAWPTAEITSELQTQLDLLFSDDFAATQQRQADDVVRRAINLSDKDDLKQGLVGWQPLAEK
jgi:hypothetical protein